MDSNLLEVLMAVSKYQEVERQAAKECADRALESAREYELIKPAAES